MQECTECGKEQPSGKFNPDSFSPTVCFSCRISGVSIGFGGYRASFHGENLVGGTISSDNRAMVETARANGHDPVPVKTAGGVGVNNTELKRLRKLHGGGDA